MRVLVGAMILFIVGVTFVIPERLSSKDRAVYLDEELAKFSEYIGSPGFTPDHPMVRSVFEKARDVRISSFRKNFNLVALLTAPMVALIAFFFLRSIYTEVALLVSSIIVFMFYHGVIPLFGSLAFIVFLWGLKLVGEAFKGFDKYKN